MSAEKHLAATRTGNTESVQIDEKSGERAPSINPERLWLRLEELGEVGAYDDERTGLRGVRRLALTKDEIAGRNLVEKWMLEQGLEVTRDRIGNVYGLRRGVREDLPVVMMGSHIDSVATAGRFDGCLGVLGGLEVLAALDDAGMKTERGMVAAYFTDEEGVRFGTDMLGSAVAVGRLTCEEALEKRDRDGVSVKEELERYNQQGDAPWLFENVPYAYLECHVEQGPVLLENGKRLGVVTGVQGISWWRVKFGGAAAHAGCTPMEMRRDAGYALSLFRSRMAALTKSMPGLLCNFGLLHTTPGLTNVIPDTAEGTVDLRHPDEERLKFAEERMHAILKECAEEARCEVLHMTQTARTEPIVFNPTIVGAVEREITRRGIDTMRLVSGAGHDAQELGSITAAGMVFVRGQNDGVSHSPREYSTKEDCADGVQVMCSLACGLAGVVE